MSVQDDVTSAGDRLFNDLQAAGSPPSLSLSLFISVSRLSHAAK